MFLLLFLLVSVSYIKLRHTTKHLDYGYRVKWFPFVPLAAIAGSLFLAITLWWIHPFPSVAEFVADPAAAAAHAATHPWVSSLLWLGVGFAVYYGYARPREAPPPAPAPDLATAHEARAAAPARPRRVLLPVANPRQVPHLAQAAAQLAREMDGELHLLYVVAVPRMLPLSEGRQFIDRALPVLESGRRIAEAAGVPVHALVRIGHDIPRVIRATAEEKEIDLVLLGWRGEPSVKDYVLGSTLDPLVADPPCDVAVLKVGASPFADTLVPTQGGRHAALSVRLGSALAKRRGGRTTLFALVPRGGNAQETRALLTTLLADAAAPGADVGAKVVEEKDVVGAITREATPGTLVVLGATEQPFWKTHLFGDKPEAVARRLPAVLLVKSRAGRTATTYRRLADRLKKWGEYLVPDEA